MKTLIELKQAAESKGLRFEVNKWDPTIRRWETDKVPNPDFMKIEIGIEYRPNIWAWFEGYVQKDVSDDDLTLFLWERIKLAFRYLFSNDALLPVYQEGFEDGKSTVYDDYRVVKEELAPFIKQMADTRWHGDRGIVVPGMLPHELYQVPVVMRMKLLGATVFPIESGSRTLKDAINEALRYWISHQADTLYCFGTAAGPHPFPTLVRQLQSVIGREARAQMLERAGRLPDVVVACVGGGSNAIGMLHPFVEDEGVRLVGVEAGGTGEPGCYNSAPINLGSPGVLHGHVTMLLQDENGQIQPSHSISAGLDYPGVGPEHAYLAETGRVHYGVICDASALNAFQTLTREEGIIPALESSHAVAWVLDHAEELPQGGDVLVNLSGRGDKDLGIVKKYLNL